MKKIKFLMATVLVVGSLALAARSTAQIFPMAIITPESATYADTRPGSTSAAQTFTVSKTQAWLPLYIFAVRVIDSTDFDLTNDNCSGNTLDGSETCTFDVAFSPSQTGHFSSNVVILSLSREIYDSSDISGKGVMPAVTLSQTSIDFGDKIIGSASAPHAVILKNSGTAALAITDISADGEFNATDTCGTTVDVGAECELDITFFPVTLGDKSGTVTITDDASDSPQTIALSGTGIAPGSADVSLSTTKLSFSAQLVGTTSAAKTVTLTSDGTINLVITSITPSGDFAETHTCAGPLAPGSSCDISVTFTPTDAGTRTGTVTIADNATDTPQTVTLEGMGVTVDAPSMSVSTSSVDFGDVNVEESSTYTITITNNGPSEMTNNSSALSGEGIGAYSKVDHCYGVDIPVGGSCSIDIIFRPNGDVTFNATLSISNNASNSPQVIAITGTGVTAGSGGCQLIVRGQ